MDDVLWNLNPPEKIDKFKTGSDSTTLNDLVVSARKKQNIRSVMIPISCREPTKSGNQNRYMCYPYVDR